MTTHVPTRIPHFQLYGEHASFADPGFVHIETIESRSRLNDWEIRPHRHETLDQLLFIREGRVAATIEGLPHMGAGPVAIYIPAGTIHGFAFEEGVDGSVISFSVDLRGALDREPLSLAALPEEPLVQAISPLPAQRIWPLLDALQLECSGHESGLRLAAGWLVGLLLIHVARAIEDAAPAQAGHDDRAQRFRALVDRHFREHRSIAYYACALGMTERSLTRMVRAKFGCAPMHYVHRRLLLEARRLLVYGDQPVARIAEELGFADPSYFSRFYTRMAGDRPSSIRSVTAGDRTERRAVSA